MGYHAPERSMEDFRDSSGRTSTLFPANPKTHVFSAALHHIAAQDSARFAALAVGGTEAEAKKAWLAKLDAPTWGNAAAALAPPASAAAQTAEMNLSREDGAKRAWLAKLET